eukprot:GEZU01016695.1.p1 GENE.GEZU01016695.1~~GEZU01016695.1.p1  ORF type:complete len:133 (-),score=11.03 GEZU01016695.1:224-595(-)
MCCVRWVDPGILRNNPQVHTLSKAVCANKKVNLLNFICETMSDSDSTSFSSSFSSSSSYPHSEERLSAVIEFIHETLWKQGLLSDVTIKIAAAAGAVSSDSQGSFLGEERELKLHKNILCQSG